LAPYFQDNGFPADVDFISVNTGVQENRTNYPPNQWLEREGWTAPVIVDDEANTVSNAFGLSGFPFWVAVDSSGAVVFRSAGVLPIADYEGLIQALSETS